MVANDRFGNFEIARGADGRPVELPRSSDEFVFLAFDVIVKRLVELHVLKSSDSLRLAQRASVMDRLKMAMDASRPSFVRILAVGEDGEVPFYSTSLNDGEFLEDFVGRRGALPPATAFSLILQVLSDILSLRSQPRLLAGLRVNNPQVTLLEDTFLQLRVVDMGLGSDENPEASSEDQMRRLVVDACEVIFLMLTGKSFAGDDCDRFPVLTGLPTGLRSIVRSSLMHPENAPSSVERLHDDVREALSTLTRDVGARQAKRHLVATDALLPKSTLRGVLLHDIALSQLLKGRLVIEGDEELRRYPFTLQATDPRTDLAVTVHLLPPKRIVPSEHYDAVPLQMWRFNADKHPNILRSLSVWESPDLTFLTEERTIGMPLSRLIAERVHLNPPEVLIIMRQVKKGVEQAMECGVERVDIHPSNIMLRLGGAPQSREMEKLLQKRLDAWPKFHVMLRPHMTMRSLYEPLLVDRGAENVVKDQFFDAKDFRNCSYIALAAYLLSGEKPAHNAVALPDSVSPELTAFIAKNLELSGQPGKAPSIADFLDSLEKLTSVPEVEQEGGMFRSLGRATERASSPMSASALAGMESVGSVSDFDDDEPSERPSVAAGGQGRTGSLLAVPSVKEKKPGPRGRVGILIWSAVVAMFVIIAMSMFSGRKSGSDGKPDAGTGKSSVPQSGGRASSSPAGGTKGDAGRPPLTPEEIRRALMPSDQEKNAVKTKQSSRTEHQVTGGISQHSGVSDAQPAARVAGVSLQLGHPALSHHLFRKVTFWTCSCT